MMATNDAINVNEIIGNRWPLLEWIHRQLHPERYTDFQITCRKTKCHVTKGEEITFEVKPLLASNEQIPLKVQVLLMKVDKSSQRKKTSQSTESPRSSWHPTKNRPWSSKKNEFTWRFESQDQKDVEGCLFVFYKESEVLLAVPVALGTHSTNQVDRFDLFKLFLDKDEIPLKFFHYAMVNYYLWGSYFLEITVSNSEKCQKRQKVNISLLFEPTKYSYMKEGQEVTIKKSEARCFLRKWNSVFSIRIDNTRELEIANSRWMQKKVHIFGALISRHSDYIEKSPDDYETIDITETEPTIPRILTFVATSDSLTKYPDPDFLKRWEEIAAPNVNSSSVTSNFNHPKIEVNINNNQNNDQNEKENKIPVIRDDYEMTSKLGLKRPYSWDDNNEQVSKRMKPSEPDAPATEFDKRNCSIQQPIIPEESSSYSECSEPSTSHNIQSDLFWDALSQSEASLISDWYSMELIGLLSPTTSLPEQDQSDSNPIEPTMSLP